MDKMLKKKVLFIGNGFMNYDAYIKNAITEDYNCSYVELSYYRNHFPYLFTLLSKIKIIKGLLQKLEYNRTSGQVQKNLCNTYDMIFLIYAPGCSLCEQDLCLLQNQNPKSKFVLYLWDNWERVDKKTMLLKAFGNQIYSFDSEDCKKYGFILRPLFFVNNNSKPKTIKYDLFHLGTCHSNRLQWMKEFRRQLNDLSISYKVMLVIGLRPYLKYLLTSPFRKESVSDLIYPFRLSYKQYLRRLSRAKAVVDIQHPGQAGLTIRTIEALAYGKKVITTNVHIVEYSDIPPFMYYIINEESDLSSLKLFLANEDKYTLPQRYSIKEFVKDLLK